ncbi:heavy-metal-associated domain-containing protein [Lacibacter sp. H407]|uniref:heavy-metal-associated domain-containing protein n=1 Tax=Lacibacter sp. H407 TaxID=3133423 RepID=UPI0030C26CF9
MNTLTFKTNIKCSGCIATATPFLDKVAGEDNWEVDVANPEKILRIEADQSVTAEQVIKAVEEAGYKAEVVK